MSTTQTQSTMSIYIPHVFANITKEYMVNIFENWKIGKVHHVDFVDKMDKKGKMYYSAYVHFDSWFDSIVSQNFQERVKNPDKEARIVYSDPWFWVCLENTSSNLSVQKVDGSGGERKIRINLDDLFAKVDRVDRVDTVTSSTDVVASTVEVKRKEIAQRAGIDYVDYLEMMNYKLMYDIRNLHGDFIMV